MNTGDLNPSAPDFQPNVEDHIGYIPTKYEIDLSKIKTV
jgi:hypothetical protein